MKLRLARKVMRRPGRYWRVGTVRRAFARCLRWEHRILAWPKERSWVAIRIEVAS